jgi:hypothetical protein
VHADQKTVVADFHKPTLMVLNLGLSSITMASGAYIANDIIKPATVVITHPNEAATQGGKARPGSRTEQLTALLKSPTVLSVAGRTIEFDGAGKCVAAAPDRSLTGSRLSRGPRRRAGRDRRGAAFWHHSLP